MKRLTVDEFIRRANQVHQNKYDYSSINYVYASKEGVKIICPIHGQFLQKPRVHLDGNGCSACSGKKKYSTEEFIEKAIQTHQYKYNYDKVSYVNTTEKIIITCTIHGDFEQLPSNHLRGQGCSDCAGNKKNTTNELVENAKFKMTLDEFIQKAQLLHEKKYGYKNVLYTNSKTKVSITCPIHNLDFKQTPNDHLNGGVCPNCSKTRKKTTEEFIQSAISKHGNKYSYDKVVYIGNNKKVIITCPKNGHGDFPQTPNKHLMGQGCPKCGGAEKSDTKSFILKAKNKHGDKYNYDNVNYVDSKTKIIIICQIHGEFVQPPSEHLSGYGCKKCGNNTKYTTEEFISKAKEIHENKYGYKQVVYEGRKEKIQIECPFHGLFPQSPNNHLNGQGCPKCSLSKGEQRIISLLENLNMNYETQFIFKDCVYKKPLPYDFIVIKNEAKYLIEFHGAQHYESINYGKNKTDLEYRNKLDKIKMEYATKNKIPILVISYLDFDRVEELVNDFLGISVK